MAPLRKEWADVRAKCDALWPKIQEEARKQAKAGGKTRKASKPRAEFDKLVSDFVHRLAARPNSGPGLRLGQLPLRRDQAAARPGKGSHRLRCSHRA